MRWDDVLLLDMLIAARKSLRFVENMNFADFSTNELVQSAVLRELQVIGEAASKVSAATKAAYPQIPWRGMVGLRNRLVHEYFQIRVDVVWQTIQEHIEPLITQLEPLVPPE